MAPLSGCRKKEPCLSLSKTRVGFFQLCGRLRRPLACALGSAWFCVAGSKMLWLLHLQNGDKYDRNQREEIPKIRHDGRVLKWGWGPRNWDGRHAWSWRGRRGRERQANQNFVWQCHRETGSVSYFFKKPFIEPGVEAHASDSCIWEAGLGESGIHYPLTQFEASLGYLRPSIKTKNKKCCYLDEKAATWDCFVVSMYVYHRHPVKHGTLARRYIAVYT